MVEILCKSKKDFFCRKRERRKAAIKHKFKYFQIYLCYKIRNYSIKVLLYNNMKLYNLSMDHMSHLGQNQPIPPNTDGFQQSFNMLKSVEDLPSCFSSVYNGSFRYRCCVKFWTVRQRNRIMVMPCVCRFFNSIQSECFHELFYSNDSMVVAAPTASGKTVLLELAILGMLHRHIDSSGRFQHKRGDHWIDHTNHILEFLYMVLKLPAPTI